jgi:hypothetical protein
VKAQHFDSWFEGLWVVESGEGGKERGGEGGIFFAGGGGALLSVQVLHKP